MNSHYNAFKVSGMFEAEVKVDCEPHLKINNLEESYLKLAPTTSSLRGSIIIEKTNFFTNDLVNCPIESYTLMQGDEVYNGTNGIDCISLSGGIVSFTGVYCKETNITVVISTTEGFTKTSSPFDVEGKQLVIENPNNNAPSFKGPIKSLGIEVNTTEEERNGYEYLIQLPEWQDDKDNFKSLKIASKQFGQLKFVNSSSNKLVKKTHNSEYLSFDLENRQVKLTFGNREQLLKFEGINAISFILEDN